MRNKNLGIEGKYEDEDSYDDEQIYIREIREHIPKKSIYDLFHQ